MMMRSLRMAAAVAVVLVWTQGAVGGEQEMLLARSYVLDVKAGHGAEFESGMGQQVNWYRQHHERWSWSVWQWETGEDLGSFVFRSGWHTWDDLDDRAERAVEARRQFNEVVMPHLDNISGSISAMLPDVSRWPEDYGEVPMVSVYRFVLKYGMAEDFQHAIKKIHHCVEEADWPITYAWSVTVSGGEVGTYWLVVPHKGYADMKAPDTPFWKMVEETAGRVEADALRELLTSCVREEHSALARFRPDLSYMADHD